MPETDGLSCYAFGCALGAILWNVIFLGLSAFGAITPATAWLGIKVVYGGALVWVALGILKP